MKKACLLILIIFMLGYGLIAQKLVVESRIWSNLEYGTESPELYNYHSYYIKFLGDTSINDTTYKLVWRSDDSLQMTWKRYGYMREDSSGRIFGRQIPNFNYDSNELILYDFSINKGDSVQIYYYGEKSVVDSISFIWINNIPHKIFYISGEKWIEGIGSLTGLFKGMNKNNYVGYEIFLVCCTDNETTLYKNNIFPSCYVNHSTFSPEVNMPPNCPKVYNTRDGLFLNIPESIRLPVKVVITDALGKILDQQLCYDSWMNLSALKLSQGLNILSVYINNQIYSFKIIQGIY